VEEHVTSAFRAEDEFCPEDVSSRFLWNIGSHLWNYMMSQPRVSQSQLTHSCGVCCMVFLCYDLFCSQSSGCSIDSTLHSVTHKAAVMWFLWPTPWSILHTSQVVADHDSRTIDRGIDT
jgi:hypothetical protein